MAKERKRCAWPTKDPLMIAYHDEEWGVPLHDDPKLFEFLILEGMQAGLSWSTVLHKRENFRKAFDNFDAVKIARYGQRHVQRLLSNPGIIRNRLKIHGAINNAQRFLEVWKIQHLENQWQTPVVWRNCSLNDFDCLTFGFVEMNMLLHTDERKSVTLPDLWKGEKKWE